MVHLIELHVNWYSLEQCLNRCDTFSFLALNLHAAIFIGIYILNSSLFHPKLQRNLTIPKHFKFVHETFHENSDTILKFTTKWHKYIWLCSLDVFIACKFIFSSCTAVFRLIWVGYEAIIGIKFYHLYGLILSARTYFKWPR